MPLENEVKIVLDNSWWEDHPVINIPYELIYQGYLSPANRIRKVVTDDKDYFLYTFKYDTIDGLVELEQQIQEKDFSLLWPICNSKLRKRRFNLGQKVKGENWIVDEFLDEKGSPYFIMAECEMSDPKQLEPSKLPKCISKHLIHKVERGDKRFFSRNLYDVELVTRLLNSIE